MREVIAETDTNPAFRARLEQAMALDAKSSTKKRAAKALRREPHTPQPKRPSNRRAPAAVDPVQLAREGETLLRDALGKLDIEQLRDVVADYGMDPGKLVMKWRDNERVIERIVEISCGRAQKGSAFRAPTVREVAPRTPEAEDETPRQTT